MDALKLRVAVAIGLCGALFGALREPAMAALSRGQLETAVKASYLTKFGPFVQWPARAGISSGPMRLCLIGRDPFGALLDEAVRGQQVRGRPLAVVRIEAVTREDAADCPILFIGEPTGQPVSETLHAVNGRPVLTVTDPASGVSGGIIQFRLRKGRVQFEVDEALARENGLGISSKLLALAVRVQRR